jgi:hypothetical protein
MQNKQSDSSTQSLQLADIDKLFRELKKIYGSSWIASFSVNERSYIEMKDLWFKALRKYSHKQVLSGLAKCVDAGKAFINLPEFVAMCKKSEQEKLYQWHKSLPTPYASEDVQQENIRKLRSILGKKK